MEFLATFCASHGAYISLGSNPNVARKSPKINSKANPKGNPMITLVHPNSRQSERRSSLTSESYVSDSDDLTEEKLLSAINPADRAYASQAISHYGLETAKILKRPY